MVPPGTAQGPPTRAFCEGQDAPEQALKKIDADLQEILRAPAPSDEKLPIWLRVEGNATAECVAAYWRRIGDENAWSAFESVFGIARRDQVLELARLWLVTRVALDRPTRPPSPSRRPQPSARTAQFL